MTKRDREREDRLRGRLASALHLPEGLSVALWRTLKCHYQPTIDLAISDEEGEDFKDLLGAARILRDYHREEVAEERNREEPHRQVPLPTQAIPVGELPTTPIEKQRTELFSAYLARRARQREEVKRFRREAMGGMIASLEETSHLLASPAICLLPSRAFPELGIPVVGHRATAELLPADREALGGLPGESRKRPWNPDMPNWPSFSPVDRPAGMLAVEWDGGSYKGIVRRADCTGPEDPGNLTSLPAGGAGIFKQTLRAWPGSFVAELASLCRSLEKSYPWRVEDAVWFVLMDYPPPASGAACEVHWSREEDYNSCRITLELQPWITADSARRIYARVQGRLLGGSNHRFLGKTLALFDFWERNRGRRKELGWEGLMKLWNGECPPEWIHTYSGNFRRAVVNAERDIAFPEYLRAPFFPDKAKDGD
jgi:hypothetical protein